MLLISWRCICPLTRPGDTLAVVGTDEQIGAWNPQHAVRLTTDASLFPLWKSVELSFCYAVFLEYKYIIFNSKGDIIWEPFDGNRVLHLNASASCVVTNRWGIKEGDSVKFREVTNDLMYIHPGWTSNGGDNKPNNLAAYKTNGGATEGSGGIVTHPHLPVQRLADVSKRSYGKRYVTPTGYVPMPPVRTPIEPSNVTNGNNGSPRSSAYHASTLTHVSVDPCDSNGMNMGKWMNGAVEGAMPILHPSANGSNGSLLSITADGMPCPTRIYTNGFGGGAALPMVSPGSSGFPQLGRTILSTHPGYVSPYYGSSPHNSGGNTSTPLILRNEYTMTEIIGNGSWGVVKAAKEHATGLERAVKHIAKSTNYKHMERIRREIDTMRALDHPNIVKLYSVYEDDTQVYLVMEYCAGGELFDRLVGGKVYSESLACRTMYQILVSVAHCHERQIAHRDLKPENFLFLDRSPSSPLKLIDFGLAAKCDPNTLMHTKIGTAYYVSPEVIQGSQHGLECDMWSVGVILYLLLCGYPPFHGNTDSEIFSKIAVGSYAFPDREWLKVSDAAKDLINLLLTRDPSKRLSAKQALSHRWFAMFNHRSTDAGALAECLTNLNQFRRFQRLSRLKQLGLAAIGQSINDEGYARLRRAFERYDTEMGFMLSKEKILRIVRDSQVGLCEDADLEETFMLLDPKETGFINYMEFLAACVSKADYKREEVCRAAFDVLDVNRRGKFSAEEAKSFCLMLGYGEAELDHDVREADLDGDGEINFDEFRNIMKKIPSLTHL